MRWILRSLLSSAVIAVAGCQPEHGVAPVTNEAAPVTVEVAAATLLTHPRTHALPGTIYPSAQATLSARLMATIATADFEIGDEVAAGDVLIKLSAQELEAQVDQAEATLAQIERNLEREENLLRQGATTAESVRSWQDQQRVARARLAEVRTLLSYTTIRAPFDGRVTRKEILRGDLATPGAPLLTLEGHAPRRVHVEVPIALGEVEEGAQIDIQSGDRHWTATLTEWSPAVDPESRTRLAQLNLPADHPLRSGHYVDVNWPTKNSTALWIPDSAPQRFGQIESVFVFEKDRILLRLIQVGRRENGRVQVLAGLEAGDQVVLDPGPSLRDLQPAILQP